MKHEKGLHFKLMILIRYRFNIKKYKLNKTVRKFYLKKICENEKSVETYKEIFSFINGKDIDKDRFYYIYWQMGNCLFDLGKYRESSDYFKMAIDNVITESYNKNKFKFKSKHYSPLLKDYNKAIDCFIRAYKFNDADYYKNLNIYCETPYNLSNEKMGDFYASFGAKNQAEKYYDKKICEIKAKIIIRHHDYDPYTDGYLEEEYNEKIKKQKDEINRIFEKINSL